MEELIEGVKEILEESHVPTVPTETIIDIIEFINIHRENEAEMEMYKTGWTPGQTDERDLKIAKLERSLETERNKVKCKHCDGAGRIVFYGGTHQSYSKCFKCDGTGRII